MSNEESVVRVADGKYEVRHSNGTGLRALRHGEPWRDLTGDGLVLALVHRIEELEEAATLRQQAARVDEVCEGCQGHGEVGGLTPQGYESQECPFCHGTGKEAALSAQPAERQGEAVAYITADNLALLKRDDGSAFGHMTAPIYSRARSEREIPLYLHPAAPVGVPDGMVLDAEDLAVLRRLRRALPDVGLNGWHRGVTVLDKVLAAAPSAPQGVE